MNKICLTREYKPILERFMLSCANDSILNYPDEDPVFGNLKETLKTLENHTFNKIYQILLEHPLIKKFIDEYKEKSFPNSIQHLEIMINEITAFLSIDKKQLKDTRPLVTEQYVKYRDFVFNINVAIIQYLKNRIQDNVPDNDKEILITRMFLRYGCFPLEGQYWSLPITFYKKLSYTNKGIVIELFTSPLNSQVIRLNDTKSYFCSLFYDTDASFGSLGNFYSLDFSKVIKEYKPDYIVANPPFIEQMLIDTFTRINEYLVNNKDDEKTLFIFSMPRWIDLVEIIGIEFSNKTIYKFELKKNRYKYDILISDNTLVRKELITRFDSLLFFLSNNAHYNVEAIKSITNNV